MNDISSRYTQIEATLALANIAELSASEVHGTIVGAISNHMKSGMTPDLLKLIEPEADANDGRFAQLTSLLYELYRDTSELLLESKDGFELMLPDEDERLEVRVEGIATWCKGFLLESGAEIARDLMEIAEAAAGANDEQEEDWALAELEEYVKVGSQLIFEFIYSERSDEAPNTSQ